ncbi:unnamed protein product [Albugo candida]|uniref:Complex III subunit 9 n=1 Tax=Albugo candida TaxID=65357 RepID=A0A024GNZ0_9STRA|nr:unnamed protein product [Albugo candida]|eukprot:CCI48612.1 unnamed protein product [Albugo candida]
METLYRAFMKRNMTYVTTIVIATIAAEAVYGTATDSFWETMNRGRLYHHVDWSKFKTEEDEDEDEEDD